MGGVYKVCLYLWAKCCGTFTLVQSTPAHPNVRRNEMQPSFKLAKLRPSLQHTSLAYSMLKVQFSCLICCLLSGQQFNVQTTCQSAHSLPSGLGLPLVWLARPSQLHPGQFWHLLEHSIASQAALPPDQFWQPNHLRRKWLPSPPRMVWHASPSPTS